ncbi:Serine hydroxymethyltransferase [compost metagenome]
MSVMATPLQGLMQELMSSVKFGWRADRDRLNLSPTDDLAHTQVAHEPFRTPGQPILHQRAEPIARGLQSVALRLFAASHASFDPCSGGQANRAVFKALLSPGDAVLCLPDPELELTLDTLYVSASTPRLVRSRAACYDNGLVDYQGLLCQARATQPRCIVAGYSAYTRPFDYRALKTIADEVGARLVIDISRIAGLVAAGIHPSPLHWADVITGATHKSLQGPRGGFFMTRDARLFLCIRQGFLHSHPTRMPPRMQRALLRGLQQADAPLEVARHQLALTNARVMSKVFQARGLSVLFGGSDTAMLLLDLTPLRLNNRQASTALGRLGIRLERRGEAASPNLLTLSTLPISVRGMDAQACECLAETLSSTLKQRHDLKTLALALASIDRLCADHPPLGSPMDCLLFQ